MHRFPGTQFYTILTADIDLPGVLVLAFSLKFHTPKRVLGAPVSDAPKRPLSALHVFHYPTPVISPNVLDALTGASFWLSLKLIEISPEARDLVQSWRQLSVNGECSSKVCTRSNTVHDKLGDSAPISKESLAKEGGEHKSPSGTWSTILLEGAPKSEKAMSDADDFNAFILNPEPVIAEAQPDGRSPALDADGIIIVSLLPQILSIFAETKKTIEKKAISEHDDDILQTYCFLPCNSVIRSREIYTWADGMAVACFERPKNPVPSLPPGEPAQFPYSWRCVTPEAKKISKIDMISYPVFIGIKADRIEQTDTLGDTRTTTSSKEDPSSSRLMEKIKRAVKTGTPATSPIVCLGAVFGPDFTTLESAAVNLLSESVYEVNQITTDSSDPDEKTESTDSDTSKTQQSPTSSTEYLITRPWEVIQDVNNVIEGTNTNGGDDGSKIWWDAFAQFNISALAPTSPFSVGGVYDEVHRQVCKSQKARRLRMNVSSSSTATTTSPWKKKPIMEGGHGPILRPGDVRYT